MAHLKNKTIRELNEKDLWDRLRQIRTDLTKLRIESKKGTLKKESGKLKPLRKDVARILTRINELRGKWTLELEWKYDTIQLQIHNKKGASMQINISGHHLDVTEAIRQYSTDKLSKIKHHFDQLININMILGIEKNLQIAEATIHVSGAELFAKAESPDMYASIDLLINKLDAQIRKHKEKLNDHRKN